MGSGWHLGAPSRADETGAGMEKGDLVRVRVRVRVGARVEIMFGVRVRVSVRVNPSPNLGMRLAERLQVDVGVEARRVSRVRDRVSLE